MNEKMNNIHIPEIIAKKLSSVCTEEETEELNSWLAKTENRETYDRILRSIKSGKHYKKFKSISTQESWHRFNNNITPVKTIQWRSALKYAAIISIPVLLALFLIFQLYKPYENEVLTYAKAHLPGSSKAQLITETGEAFELEKLNVKEITDQNIKIENSGKSLIYNKSIGKKLQVRESYHTLSIPTGGEWYLELVDGTKIWLNSESTIKYPKFLVEKERIIELEGEAYFEVAANPDKPFIVKTKKGRVEVLGTKFNVHAYNDEEANITTLVEGKVSLEHPFNESSRIILKPGSQGEIISVNHKIRVNKVNVQDFIAWKNQRFVFNQQPLSEIFKKLSRWYGAEFSFEKESLKKIRITADIKRFNDLSTILSFIEDVAETPVKFKVKNNKLMVSIK